MGSANVPGGDRIKPSIPGSRRASCLVPLLGVRLLTSRMRQERPLGPSGQPWAWVCGAVTSGQGRAPAASLLPLPRVWWLPQGRSRSVPHPHLPP